MDAVTQRRIIGPWAKSPHLSDSILDADGGLVATVWGKTREEAKARIALIETAPILLAELVKAVDLIHRIAAESDQDQDQDHDDTDSMLDAIGKAVPL